MNDAALGGILAIAGGIIVVFLLTMVILEGFTGLAVFLLFSSPLWLTFAGFVIYDHYHDY